MFEEVGSVSEELGKEIGETVGSSISEAYAKIILIQAKYISLAAKADLDDLSVVAELRDQFLSETYNFNIEGREGSDTNAPTRYQDDPDFLLPESPFYTVESTQAYLKEWVKIENFVDNFVEETKHKYEEQGPSDYLFALWNSSKVREACGLGRFSPFIDEDREDLSALFKSHEEVSREPDEENTNQAKLVL